MILEILYVIMVIWGMRAMIVIGMLIIGLIDIIILNNILVLNAKRHHNQL